ncbi:MAG: choice-of-anchor J domain-containing protein, partial [Bacteroidetes bacterium]|nr:choice-of-anchor J domain-containing protein [Bacteroidota bacterium]MDA0879881.1 choice-of-anchor J domain-containing protein [Bacteroidota bacterium]
MKKITLLSFLLFSSLVFSQFSEDFEGGVPGSFVATVNSGSATWGNCSGSLGGQTCPMNGLASASYYAGNYNGNSATLTTPTLDLSSLPSYQLKFSYSQKDWGGDQNTLSVEVSSDDGSNWTVLTLLNTSVSAPTEVELFLDGYTSSTTKIRFVAVSNYGYATILDDVVVQPTPSCLYPADFVVSDITAVGATLAWSGGSTSSGNVVDFDASATFLGYMNWFELPANGGGYVNGSSWTVAALKSVLNTGANTLTLQPNFNTYAENPTDAYWVNQTTGAGNKNMQAATFVEDATANGADLTFQGSVSSYTLDAAYTAKYFIKALDPANGWADVFGGSKTFDLPQSGNFSVSATAAELPAGLVVQYGFEVFGANANPADEVALGSVVVTASLDIWEYELVLAGETPTGVGTSTTNNPLTITGCYSNTGYDLYVRRVCDSSYSDWTMTSFTTDCDAVTAFPYSHGFETLDCWNNASSSTPWALDDGTDYGPGTVTEGVSAVFFNDYDFASGSTSDLMSPWIDASTLTSPRLTFDYYDAGGSDTVKVLVYDGTTTTVVYTTAGTVTPWTQIVVDLPEYGGETFKIGFRGTSVYGASNPHIDNLVLDEGPSCLPPSDFVVSDITAVGATLAWSGGSTSS